MNETPTDMIDEKTMNGASEGLFLSKIQKGAIIMMEHSADSYFHTNAAIIKQLVDDGYQGIYVSFQRPFNNVVHEFESIGINIDNLRVIDAASAFTDEKQSNHPYCVSISKELKIDDLVRSMYTVLSAFESEKQFVFIDSLTTITLYKPLSETMRFSEFLVRTIRKKDGKQLKLIFNVASDLSQKKFIQDIAFRVDHVVKI